ncbi:MAG TPA: hypothetical protein GX692_04165 [Acholeplasmataceae bacterium]|jgi:hypothetical protein|nr:hypothetical protein [Acholeplasmataceae bacterium]
MKLLITIVDRNHSDKFVNILNKVPRFQGISLGKGTATSDILDYLGIGETGKDVVWCVVEDEDVEGIFAEFSKYKEFTQMGAVAFTLSIANIGKKFYNLIKALEVKDD